MAQNLNFIGKNIRFFRRARNWTLACLASKIGIQEGPLGRIERGVNLPSATVIYSLTQALDIPANALFAPDIPRARAAVDDKDALLVTIDPAPLLPPKKLLIACREIMTAFHALEDILKVQKHAFFPLSIPFEPDYPGMENLAARVRNYMGTADAVVFDYIELFENHGLRIIFFPFQRDAAAFDALSFYEPSHQNAFFFINSKNNPEKQLFSLARELGKILIFNKMRTRNDSIFSMPETESPSRPINPARAAGKFAAVFLMPETAVRTTVGQLGISPESWTWEILLRIKHRFGISAEAFLYRLLELDLISPSLSDTLKIKIKQHYDQTGFGEPDNSRRILNANGRFFDLLLTAGSIDSAREEVDEIERMVMEYKIIKI